MTTALPCPICEIPMSEVEVSGLPLDECTACPGLWFDSGELQRCREERRLGKASREFIADATIPPRRCPRCATQTLQAGVLTAETGRGAPFHRCERCGGSYVTEQILPVHERKVSAGWFVDVIWRGVLRLFDLDRMNPTDQELDRARGKVGKRRDD